MSCDSLINSLHNTCCALAATSCPLTCTSMASLLRYRSHIDDNFRESCPSRAACKGPVFAVESNRSKSKTNAILAL